MPQVPRTDKPQLLRLVPPVRPALLSRKLKFKLGRLAVRRRRMLLRILVDAELHHAERLTRLRWTRSRSYRVDVALRLHDAVREIGGGK